VTKTHYYVEGDERLLDSNILGVLARYLMWGLDCGNFGMQLVSRDDRPSDLAAMQLYRSASEHLRPDIYNWRGDTSGCPPEHCYGGKNDVVNNLLGFVRDRFPPEARGSREAYWAWCNKGGFHGQPKKDRMLMKLTGQYQWVEDILKLQGYTSIWDKE
jgi:hypothetical protein